jgi:exonuclease SbcD
MDNNVTILFFADSHLGFDYPIKPKIKKRRRGDDFFRNFHMILQKAIELKVDLVIHGGDVFFRSKVHQKIVDKTYDAIFNLAESGIPIVIVPGNHDRSKLPSSLFLQHSNIHIFHDADVFHFHFKGTQFNICGFPFIKYIGDEISQLIQKLCPKLKDEAISLLCMHQAVEGATVGPANYRFRGGKEVIRLQDLKGPFSAYLSGHIHRYQVLWSDPDNSQPKIPFIYPGSIERTSFAEITEEKGYILLTFKSSRIPDIAFHQLPSRPMHILPIPEDCLEKTEMIHLVKSKIAHIEKDSILRIDSPNEIISKGLDNNSLRALSPPGVDIQLRHTWLAKNYYKRHS